LQTYREMAVVRPYSGLWLGRFQTIYAESNFSVISLHCLPVKSLKWYRYDHAFDELLCRQKPRHTMGFVESFCVIKSWQIFT